MKVWCNRGEIYFNYRDMENSGQSQEVSTAFVEFDKKNQENTIEVWDLFKQLQLNDSDYNIYKNIQNSVADITKALGEFNNQVDEKTI